MKTINRIDGFLKVVAVILVVSVLVYVYRMPPKKPVLKTESVYHTLNIALFGPPGAGKGTQAARLEKKYELIHISTGDLFRKNINDQTPLGLKINEYVSKGELVPDSLVIRAVEEEIKKSPKAKGFLFDGFPRTVSQAETFEFLLKKYGICLNIMISLDIPFEEVKKRIEKRGKEQNRMDDQNPENLITRMQAYKDQTLPVATFYKAKNLLFEVEAQGSVDEVFAKIDALIEKNCLSSDQHTG